MMQQKRKGKEVKNREWTPRVVNSEGQINGLPATENSRSTADQSLEARRSKPNFDDYEIGEGNEDGRAKHNKGGG